MTMYRDLKTYEIIMPGDEYLAMDGKWYDVGPEMPGHTAGECIRFRRGVR